METRNIILGLEFGERESRLCVYDRTQREVVSLPLWGDEEGFPTAISRETDREVWYVGQDAVNAPADSSVILLDTLFEIVDGRTNVPIENHWYTPAELLAQFLSGVFRKAGIGEPEKQISAIMITCRRLTRNLVEHIRQAYEILGLPRSKGYIQENDESFYYYTVSQKPELWNRSVGCFLVEEEEVSFLRLTISNRTKPATARVDRTGKYPLSVRPEFRGKEFLDICREIIGPEIYTCMFLTGRGFSTEWSGEALKELGKRQCKLFGGNNIFASGACYGAREKVDEKSARNMLFLGNDLVRSNISMELMANGSRTSYVLINAGIHWYEAEKECELLLDGARELEFTVTAMENGKVSRYTMPLTDLPERPRRTTRILLRLTYESPTILQIRAEDLGFGEMFPASGLIWNETLEEVRKNS